MSFFVLYVCILLVCGDVYVTLTFRGCQKHEIKKSSKTCDNIDKTHEQICLLLPLADSHVRYYNSNKPQHMHLYAHVSISYGFWSPSLPIGHCFKSGLSLIAYKNVQYFSVFDSIFNTLYCDDIMFLLLCLPRPFFIPIHQLCTSIHVNTIFIIHHRLNDWTRNHPTVDLGTNYFSGSRFLFIFFTRRDDGTRLSPQQTTRLKRWQIRLRYETCR